MARNVLWFVTIILLGLMQTTWPDMLKVREVQPDLILILVVYFAIIEGEERAMFTGVFGGIFLDVASTAILGHHILCLIVVGYSVGRFSKRLVTEHPAIKAGLVFCSSAATGILYTCVLYVQKPELLVFQTIGTSVIPGAFYTAFITPIFFFILARIFQRKPRREEASK